MNKKVFLSLGILSTTMLSSALAAEETITNGAIVTYEKDYFIKYSPVNLLDMLQRIPGVQDILDENKEQRQAAKNGGGANAQGGRGFGSGGDQILINGKRLAGKSNNIDDTLSRISSSQIKKIELIRGATSGLDVQSQGLVINVIMLEDGGTSTTFWKIGTQIALGKNKLPPEILVSHSGSSGNLQYMVSGEVKNGRAFFDRDERHFNAAKIQTGEKFVTNAMVRQNLILNTNLSYEFNDGSELRLNGLYEPSRMERDEEQNEIGSQPSHTLWDSDEEFDKWEIGGDFSKKPGFLGDFKTLFVINKNKKDTTIIRDRNYSAVDEFQYALENTTVDKSEKILRASITNNITAAQSLELGGEVAINTFNKAFTDNRRNSAVDAFAIQSSDNVEIKENRYEIFANHTYNISSKIVLQSSLTTEFSKIVANSIVTNTTRNTSFTYLKPRMNLRYDVTNNDQFRFTVEKQVSQLNFNNFVTSYDQRIDQLLFGNTEIRPEQVWNFSAVYEHRLPNDSGSFEIEIFYRDYTDYINKVDFTEYENMAGTTIGVEEFFALPADDITALRNIINFTSKSGNIDGATAKGIKLKSNLRLGFVGLPQAVIGFGYEYEKRRFPDQFTLESANFNRTSDHTFTFNYRHDVTEWDFSYGFDGKIRSKFELRERNYIWPWTPGTFIRIFAEKSVYKGIKLRVEAQQEDSGTGRSTLNIYSDHRRFNDLHERSEKNHKRPREVTISLQGTF